MSKPRKPFRAALSISCISDTFLPAFQAKLDAYVLHLRAIQKNHVSYLQFMIINIYREATQMVVSSKLCNLVAKSSNYLPFSVLVLSLETFGYASLKCSRIVTHPSIMTTCWCHHEIIFKTLTTTHNNLKHHTSFTST
jgi:hypothetical protein